jgi:hypothetical protein
VIWWAMSAESAILALEELGLNPDPPEIERLSAIAIGKTPPCGDAAREQSLRRQIFLAARKRRILIQFERKPRPRDVAAQLRKLAMACRTSARALRGLGKHNVASLFSGFDLGDRFAQAERFDDPPGGLSRLRMLQLAGVEQELAGVLASLALEAAYAVVDERHTTLVTLANAQERLCAAWRNLSDPALERLFDATPLWALSQPEEEFEVNPAFWRLLGPPTPAADVDLIRRHLLKKALVVAEHADARRRAFVAAWPDKGGVSPLVGSANARLSKALMKAIHDVLGPESYARISSYPGAAYDRLLLAVAEMATGEKPAERAFSDVLRAVPKRTGSKDRRERAARTRQAQYERKATEAAAKDALSAAERVLDQPIARTGGELRRHYNLVQQCLSWLRHMTDNKAVETKIVALKRHNEHIEAALKKLN